MSRKWMWLAFGIVVGAAIGGWVSGPAALKTWHDAAPGDAGTTRQAAAFAPPTVTVIRPANRRFVETVRVSGSLIAREEVLIAPQIEGQRVRELLVDAGDKVEKGQLLATLATENLDAQLAQIDAAIKRAGAGVAQARSSIMRAEARLSEAAASLKRAELLRKSGYLSQSILEQRETAAASARADLAIAKDSLKQAQGDRAEAEAKRRELLWRRSHTAIHAPVAGLVLTRSAKIGAIATALGEPMFRIVKAGEIEFEAEATASQLPAVKSGQAVTIDVPGADGVHGTVRLVSPQVDQQTRLGKIRVFIGDDDRLRVGTFATGLIETSRGQGRAIPSSSIMRDAAGPYVQIVVGGKVHLQRIKTGLASNGFTEVVDGLTDTDQVVAKAGTFLGEGERITPVETPPTNGVPASPKAG